MGETKQVITDEEKCERQNVGEYEPWCVFP